MVAKDSRPPIAATYHYFVQHLNQQNPVRAAGGHQGISKSLFCRHAGDPKQQPHRKSRAHIFNNDILATIRQGRENEKNSCTYMSDSSVTAPMKSRETSSNRCSNDSAISMLYGRSLYATNKTSSRLMKVYLAFSKS